MCRLARSCTLQTELIPIVHLEVELTLGHALASLSCLLLLNRLRKIVVLDLVAVLRYHSLTHLVVHCSHAIARTAHLFTASLLR